MLTIIILRDMKRKQQLLFFLHFLTKPIPILQTPNVIEEICQAQDTIR